MSKLIRKQVYIEPSQDRRIKRKAREEGIPEAEIVRRALDLGLVRLPVAPRVVRLDEEASFFDLIDRLIEQGPVPGGRRWSRDELYDRGGSD